MDPRDPSEQPSIFRRPDPSDDRDVTRPEPTAPRRGDEQPLHDQPRHDEPRYGESGLDAPSRDPLWRNDRSREERPMSRRPMAPPPSRRSGPSRGALVAIGVGALLVLGVGAFVAASVLGPDDGVAVASPSVAPSPTPTPPSASPTPSEEPSATPAPSPTPAPTPAGPPQEVPVGAWATVAVDELSVRSSASSGSPSDYLLVRGAVVHVAEGPAVVDGVNWYRIASLGGAVGWVFAGWVEEPFVTTLVADPTLIRCGEVEGAVFDVVDGAPVPHDPIALDGLALPAAAFSDLSLGAMELIRGVGGEACISAQLGSDGVPFVTSQLSVGACGHAVADGSVFRLRPAAGQDAPLQSQVKDPAIVHPAVLDGGPSSERQSSNLRGIMLIMASGPDASGCIHLNVTEDPGGVEAFRDLSTSTCAIVSEYNADNLRLTPIEGETEVWIKLAGGTQPGIFPLGEPVEVAVSANVYEEGRNTYAYTFDDPDCR
jgi:hypothetical protein